MPHGRRLSAASFLVLVAGGALDRLAQPFDVGHEAELRADAFGVIPIERRSIHIRDPAKLEAIVHAGE